MQIYIIRLLSTYVKVAGTGLELELPLMAIALEKKKEEKERKLYDDVTHHEHEQLFAFT